MPHRITSRSRSAPEAHAPRLAGSRRSSTSLISPVRPSAFAGSGEMRGLMRAHDWTSTPFGPVETWPSALRALTEVMLGHACPSVVLWGPELLQLYNDAYRAVLGARHPAGLGQPTRECWPEEWHDSAPIYERVRRGESVAVEDVRVPITRSTGAEDAWFTICYSPAYDDGGAVGGVFVTTIDTTARHRAEATWREQGAWLRGQQLALEAALMGAPLTTSLGALVRTVTEQLGEGTQAAFFLANGTASSLRHVVGMPPGYALAVDGLESGPESLAADLPARDGQGVLTADVLTDPAWEPWRWLAERFDFRGCWSAPIRSSAGTFIGALAIYSRQPRQATERDLEYLSVLTHIASIIISREVDAKARQQAEAELRTSKMRLITILEKLPVGVGLADAGGRFVVRNSLMREMVADSMPSREPDHERRWQGFDAEGGMVTPEQWPGERALRGERSTMELSRSDGDGDRTIFVSAVPMMNATGDITGAISVAQDITDRKRAEAELRASEERYHSLFDSIDEGFCIVEVLYDERGHAVDYVFLETNPAFERQTGLSGVVGSSMRRLAPGHEQHWFEALGRIASTGEPERFEDRAEELGRWYDVFAWRYGNPVRGRVAVLFDDITERKQAETELRDALAAKDQFLGFVSHELRTPMTIILGMSRVLASKARGALEKDLAADIATSAEELGDLIDALLLLARLESDRGPHPGLPSHLGHVIERVLERQRARDADRDYRFRAEASESAVEGEETWLERILVNLVGNAAKYSPPGAPVTVVLEGGDDEIRVRVLDEGDGLDAAEIEHLFEPFFRGSSHERQVPGAGLGLAVCKRIVDSMAGRMWARTRPSGGAEFGFAVPSLPRGSRSAAAEAHAARHDQRGRTA